MLNIDRLNRWYFCRDNFPQQAVTNGAHYRAGFATLAPLRQQLGSVVLLLVPVTPMRLKLSEGSGKSGPARCR